MSLYHLDIADFFSLLAIVLRYFDCESRISPMVGPQLALFRHMAELANSVIVGLIHLQYIYKAHDVAPLLLFFSSVSSQGIPGGYSLVTA